MNYELRISSTHQSGQILLITLLVLSVALTVALSVIGRTTTDVSISSQIEESNRAFSAAEAGIEEALRLGAAPGGTLMLSQSNTTADVTATTVGTTDTYDAGVAQVGEAKTIWLIPHDPVTGDPVYAGPGYGPSRTITVCWSNSAALEITVYYEKSGSIGIAKSGYDPTGSAIGYTAASANIGDICGEGTQLTDYFTTIDFSSYAPDTLYMMRIRPKYSQSLIRLKAQDPLPGLGNEFTSCGSSVPGVTRCIKAYQLYPEPPDLFDYVLYSNTGPIQ